jgi:hypothetical protein
MFLVFKKKIIPISILFVFIGSIFCSSPFSVEAQEREKKLRIMYQGELTDSQGEAVEDGRYNMRFTIYDSKTEGDILWQEEYTFYNSIFVEEGVFKVILGRRNPIGVDFSQGPFWLDVDIGQETEEGDITWDIGTEKRKQIVSLSNLVENEGINQSEINDISNFVEERIGDDSDSVVLFDLNSVQEENINEESSFSFSVFKNFVTFISDSLSDIKEAVSKIGEKIDQILMKLEKIIIAITDISKKIDVLYKVLIVDEGIAPLEEEIKEDKIYSKQKVESLVLKRGSDSIRIFNSSIKEGSLIFISFVDEPGSAWWISEKVPGHSFTISLKEKSENDLRFNYWILNESGSGIIESEEEINENNSNSEDSSSDDDSSSTSTEPSQETEENETSTQPSSEIPSDDDSSSTSTEPSQEPEPEPEPDPESEPEENSTSSESSTSSETN